MNKVLNLVVITPAPPGHSRGTGKQSLTLVREFCKHANQIPVNKH